MQVMLAVILFWFEWPALIESHTHKMGNEGITGYLRKQTEAFVSGQITCSEDCWADAILLTVP